MVASRHATRTAVARPIALGACSKQQASTLTITDLVDSIEAHLPRTALHVGFSAWTAPGYHQRRTAVGSICQTSSSTSLRWSMQPCISSATEALSIVWKDGSICSQTCTQRMNSSGTRSLPYSRTNEADAEDFEIWEDDDVAEEEQADEEWQRNQSLPLMRLHIVLRRSHVLRSHPDLPCANGSLLACSNGNASAKDLAFASCRQ